MGIEEIGEVEVVRENGILGLEMPSLLRVVMGCEGAGGREEEEEVVEDRGC